MTEMDFATIIGLVAGIGVVGAAILVGGDFMSFVDVGSMMIVIGGRHRRDHSAVYAWRCFRRLPDGAQSELWQ